MNVQSRKNAIGMRRCFARFSTAGNTMTETTKTAKSRMVAQAGMPRSDALQGGQQADADEGDEKDAPIIGRPMLAGAADLVVAGHDDDEAGDAQRHVDEEHPVPAQRADDDAGEHRSDKRGDAPSEVVLKAMTFGRRFSRVTPAMIVKVTVMMAPPPVPSGRERR